MTPIPPGLRIYEARTRLSPVRDVMFLAKDVREAMEICRVCVLSTELKEFGEVVQMGDATADGPRTEWTDGEGDE